jgi:hypothetical protein
MSQFIGIYDNFLPKEFCEELIDDFERISQMGLTISRFKSENAPRTSKDDTALFQFETPMGVCTGEKYSKFLDKFWGTAYQAYAQEFSTLKNIDNHSIFSIKIQKTKIGGGYHNWHCESSDRGSSSRVAVFIAYLNDVDEGGETEFLYQHMRVKPETGKLVIFPAGYTHTHRGNPPLSNDKYIITGWIEF